MKYPILISAFALGVIAAQEKEIGEMRAWLAKRSRPGDRPTKVEN